jgi:Tripartite tricarboxylate transporter family receptor
MKDDLKIEHTRRHFGLPPCAFCIALALPATVVAAPPEYPTRPIRIIAQFTPGTSTDILARIVAQKMSEHWGQQVIVDNRPGAGAVIGTVAAKNATPDGYTLVMAVSSAFGINPTLYANLPYDAVRDFEPISNLGLTPQTLVAGRPRLSSRRRSSSPRRRKNPGRSTMHRSDPARPATSPWKCSGPPRA